MSTMFELTFLDGETRTVEALNFSCAKAVAAYKRHTEEGCDSHKQLTVDDKKCRRVGAAPNAELSRGEMPPANTNDA